MSTNEGPLSRLMRLLGVSDKLKPIPEVKRIEEYPVKLSDRLWSPPVTDLRGLDIRYEYKGSFRGQHIWLCWDAVNGQETCGEGDSKRMALTDFLDKRYECVPSRVSRMVNHSPFQPPEVSSEPYRDPDEE